ncbi:hypothetical protein [Glaciimonas sp. PAMC28666]|uniref:hypothetical protein n=1 Tax=Glaciimonas sp. PAMC28666 TaxID=2807626 RepID=UPI0019654E9F|nr:hypothetical protein [Glaciimonas sp. PAMC28666]QRX80905.1 hypothetical protein JQN73_11775 [Glaciimonas sp. PAMC28666]
MMKLLMQMCVFLFMFFAIWGISDALHLMLDRWKLRFHTVINGVLTGAVMYGLVNGMLWGAGIG